MIHNHQCDEGKINRQLLLIACKRKVKEDISKKSSKLIPRAVQTSLPDSHCIKKHL